MCGECGGSEKVVVLYIAPCYWPNCGLQTGMNLDVRIMCPIYTVRQVLVVRICC